MIQIFYVVIQMAEVLLNIWIVRHLFPERRENRRWAYCAAAAGYIIIGAMYAWNNYTFFISNIFILFFALQFSCVYCICHTAKFVRVFLLETFYMTSLSFFKLSIVIIECIVSGKSIAQVNRGERTLAECIWCVALTVIIAVVVMITKRKETSGRYKRAIQLLLSEEIKLMAAVTAVQWSLLSYNMWLGVLDYQTDDFTVNVLLIFSLYLCLNYLILRAAYREMRQDNSRLDLARELLQKQNNELHEIYMNNREQVHEQRHILEYLYYCIGEEKYEEAKKFLLKHLDKLKEKQPKVWTGFPFLDFIINYKKQTMDRKNIVLQLKLGVCELPLEEAELGILLGNLLDNAIEACEKCEPEKREIYLRIWNLRYMFMLKLRNSSSKAPTLIGKRLITDKADKNLHGIGLGQVRQIVEKYGGDISFQYSEFSYEDCNMHIFPDYVYCYLLCGNIFLISVWDIQFCHAEEN